MAAVERRYDDDGSFTEVTGERRDGFAFLLPLVTLGLWIQGDSAVRVAAFVDEASWRPAQLRLEARVLHHHQVLFLLPVVWSDDGIEQQIIDQILARARAGGDAVAPVGSCR